MTTSSPTSTSEGVAVNTCSSCRFWTTDSDWFGGDDVTLTPLPEEEKYGPEHRERIEAARALFRTCKRVLMVDRYESVERVPLAYTVDGSGYRADLRTQGTFGCVLHEPVP